MPHPPNPSRRRISSRSAPPLRACGLALALAAAAAASGCSSPAAPSRAERPNPGARAAEAARVLRCESRDGGRTTCPAGGRVARVDIVAGESSAACELGKTWGFTLDAVWVDGGCAGTFRAFPVRW